MLDQISYTSTVDQLLKQNQEMMTRLSIQIRRVAELEEGLMNESKARQLLNSQKESLFEEVQISREQLQKEIVYKNQLIQERNSIQQQFAQFYTDTKETSEYLEKENTIFSNQIGILKSYERRVKTWVRPFIDSLKAQLESSIKRIITEKEELERRNAQLIRLNDDLSSELGHENERLKFELEYTFKFKQRILKNFKFKLKPFVKNLKKEYHNLNDQFLKQSEVLKATELNLGQALKKLADLHYEYEKNQARLVEFYESKSKSTDNELLQTKQDLAYFKEQNFKSQSLFENTNRNKIEIENKLIYVQKHLSEADKKYDINISKLQSDYTRISEKFAAIDSELNITKETLKSVDDKNTELIKESADVKEKNQRINVLLDQALSQLEKLRQKEASARHLNIDLSHNMRLLRDDYEKLKIKHSNTAKDNKELKIAIDEKWMISDDLNPKESKELGEIKRITHLLTEIQSDLFVTKNVKNESSDILV